MVLHQPGRLHQAQAPLVPEATQYDKLHFVKQQNKEKINK